MGCMCPYIVPEAVLITRALVLHDCLINLSSWMEILKSNSKIFENYCVLAQISNSLP